MCFFLIKAASFVVTSVHTSLHFYLLCDVSLQRFNVSYFLMISHLLLESPFVTI